MSRTTGCGRNRLARLVAVVLITLSGRRGNALRGEEEGVFHSAAIANSGANQRSPVGLAVAMVVMFGLGAAGMAVVARRRRSDITQVL
jgi:hypothetical protein